MISDRYAGGVRFDVNVLVSDRVAQLGAAGPNSERRDGKNFPCRLACQDDEPGFCEGSTVRLPFALADHLTSNRN